MQSSHKRAAVLARLTRQRAERASARVPGEFQFPTQLVGETSDGRVRLYYDPSLRQAGLKVAQAVLRKLDSLYADNDSMFGVAGKSGNVIIAALPDDSGVPRKDGSTGAFHGGCGFNDDSPEASDWYEDVAVGNPEMTFGLVQAEVSESYMGLQNKGWDCGGSNGEALSRVLAEFVSGGPDGELREYATGPAWARDGFPNWVDANEGSDLNPVSTGCGVVYLYWMLSKGFTLSQIVQAGCPHGVLAGNYRVLTGKATAWADFSSAVNALPHEIAGDNPWSGGGPPAQHAGAGQGLTLTFDPVAKTVTIPAGYRIVTARDSDGDPGDGGS
jgi:hypothetical protein